MNFFKKYQKIFLILGFLLFSIFLGFLIFITFFKDFITQPPSTGTTATTTTTTGGTLPTSGEGSGGIIVSTTTQGRITGSDFDEGITPEEEPISTVARGGLTQIQELTKTPTLGVSLNKNGNDINYYNQTDGKFYTIDKNGNKVLLSTKVFHNVENVTWSPQSTKAIIEYPDGANILYNFETGKQTTLPKHWEEFEYSTDGNSIVSKSIGQDPDNRLLTTSNDDGSKVQILESMGEYADTVYTSWSPNNQTVAMYTKGVDFNRQEVYFIGKNDENFKYMTIEGRGFQPEWSEKGDKLLYSVYSSDTDMNPTLWITSAQGDDIGNNRKHLKVETWAEKCVFANNTEVYCAVPDYLRAGSGIFPETADSTTDSLYKINTITGARKLVAVPDGDHNISDPVISENGNHLYFTDKTNENKLYEIQLK